MNTLRVYTSDGVQTRYDVDFDLGYLDKSHIYVYAGTDHTLHESELAYIWVSTTEIELTDELEYTAGTKINIRRVVPQNSLYVTFKNAVGLTDKALNSGNAQAMMVLEEVSDGFKGSEYYEKQNLNLGGFTVINIRDGEDPQDIVTVSQLDSRVSDNQQVAIDAAASAAAALADRLLTNIDAGLTHADATQTALDRLATAADVVLVSDEGDTQVARVLAEGDTQETRVIELLGTPYGLPLPAGTTAERPTIPLNGMIRYNTDILSFEGYSDGEWTSVGGGASGATQNPVFYENDTNVTGDYTITTGKNAMSAGPITINAGVSVEVPVGSVWTVV